MISLPVNERLKLSMTRCNKWRSLVSHFIRNKLNEVLQTKNISAPFIGLGTIFIHHKCPKCRTLTKDLSIFKAKRGLRGLIIPVISNRSPWRTYIPKCLRTSSKPTLKHYVQLSCFDIIILRNCWVRFLELITYLENSLLGKKKVLTDYWRKIIYASEILC